MRHRAVVLIVLMLLAIAMVVFGSWGALASMTGGSWIALGVVLATAAVAGVAFSWGRYYAPRKR